MRFGKIEKQEENRNGDTKASAVYGIQSVPLEACVYKPNLASLHLRDS